MIRSVIIDDEMQARKVLKNLLASDFPHVEVVGEGDDIDSGMEAIRAWQPDLVFLDIQLKSGTGFELLTRLGDENVEVIFVTAYDNYALTAFQFAAFGYLLKPLRISELQRVLLRFEEQQRLKQQARQERLKVLIESYEDNGQVKKLIVQHLNGFQVLPLNEIIYLKGEDNYTRFILEKSEQTLVSKTLKDYEQLLSDFGFYRIHQSYLVNLRHIREYTKGEGGTVTMHNHDELPVSRRKKAGFLKKFLG
ncbi:MAG: LytTR family DNA-binding domain-containing protein [Bacteroidia bacterium]|nr:LytTR family DNA-binding domain-containing protein [Bacteroidia bacterium]